VKPTLQLACLHVVGLAVIGEVSLNEELNAPTNRGTPTGSFFKHICNIDGCVDVLLATEGMTECSDVSRV